MSQYDNAIVDNAIVENPEDNSTQPNYLEENPEKLVLGLETIWKSSRKYGLVSR